MNTLRKILVVLFFSSVSGSVFAQDKPSAELERFCSDVLHRLEQAQFNPEKEEMGTRIMIFFKKNDVDYIVLFGDYNEGVYCYLIRRVVFRSELNDDELQRLYSIANKKTITELFVRIIHDVSPRGESVILMNVPFYCTDSGEFANFLFKGMNLVNRAYNEVVRPFLIDSGFNVK